MLRLNFPPGKTEIQSVGQRFLLYPLPRKFELSNRNNGQIGRKSQQCTSRPPLSKTRVPFTQYVTIYLSRRSNKLCIDRRTMEETQ